MNLLGSLITYYADEVTYTGNSDVKFLGVSINTWATITTTLFVVFLSLLAKHIYDEYQKRVRIRNLKSYYLTSALLLVEPLRKQKEYVEEFAKRITDFDTRNFILKIETALTALDLNSAASKDVLEYFISENSNIERFKNIRDLRVQINKVEFLTANLQATFSDFKELYDRHEDAWQDTSREVRKFHDSFFQIAAKAKLKLGVDSFLDTLHKNLGDWVEQEKKGVNIRTPERFYNDFVVKTREPAMNRMFSEVDGSPISADQVSNYFAAILDLESHFKELQNLRAQYKVYFEDEAKSIQNVIERIEELVPPLK